MTVRAAMHTPSSTRLHFVSPEDEIKLKDEQGHSPTKLLLQSIENVFIFFLPFDLLCNIFFVLLLTFYFHLVPAFD